MPQTHYIKTFTREENWMNLDFVNFLDLLVKPYLLFSSFDYRKPCGNIPTTRHSSSTLH